jgi:hypothetical protein
MKNIVGSSQTLINKKNFFSKMDSKLETNIEILKEKQKELEMVIKDHEDRLLELTSKRIPFIEKVISFKMNNSSSHKCKCGNPYRIHDWNNDFSLLFREMESLILEARLFGGTVEDQVKLTEIKKALRLIEETVDELF